MKLPLLYGLSVLLFTIVSCTSIQQEDNPVIQPDPIPSSAEITMLSRSGNSELLMEMPSPLAPTSNSSGLTDSEWSTTIDSAGVYTVVFLNSGSLTTSGDEIGDSSISDMSYFSILSDREYSEKPGIVYSEVSQNISAGLLTAGEWHDHLYWADFQTFIRQYPDLFVKWQLDYQRRVLIKVIDLDGHPVPGARITIGCEGTQVFNALSSGDGSIAFFPTDAQTQDADYYEVTVTVGQQIRYHGMFSPVKDDDQTWEIQLDQQITVDAPILDLVFTVDVTGSMADELRYIQAELLDICEKIYTSGINDLRVGFVFYRDRGDRFVTKMFPFTTDVASAKDNIAIMAADGGGDMPESLNLALKHTLQNLEWRNKMNCIRLCFLVADAPPHFYCDEQYIYRHALDEAVETGVKIIPVAGSGADKATEYLFRHMAVKTMGRYIFLTDDSGIGDAHIDPDIGDHDTELLNDIIIRTINEELQSWQQ